MQALKSLRAVIDRSTRSKYLTKMAQMSTTSNTIDSNINKKLSGKVAIITGGASGIGEETARRFAYEGSSMVVIADIQDELGQKVANSIGANRCAYVHCDVTREDHVKSLVQWTVQNFGHLDIMFSNAGITPNSEQDIMDLDLLTYDKVMSVNARGMATCVKHAARAMVEGHVKGSIVCTSSTAGSRGIKRWIDYTMSKHALAGLVKLASRQLGVHGIRVNSVSPHGMVTPLTTRAFEGKSQEEIEEYYGRSMSLKGVKLKTSHLVDAVLFLCCDDSALITGHDLAVDGGCFNS